MYNYLHKLIDYETDEEYEKELLSILGLDDIMDNKLDIILEEVYNRIKAESVWIELLIVLAKEFALFETPTADLGLPIGLSYTHLKQIHVCLYEYYNTKSTTLVHKLLLELNNKN
jgi:hypothetical protein